MNQPTNTGHNMRRLWLIALVAMLAGCYSTGGVGSDARDAGGGADAAPDVTAKVSADAGLWSPDVRAGCEVAKFTEDQAREEAAKRDGVRRRPPTPCEPTKGCASYSLEHWCNTDCPDGRPCNPGGSWASVQTPDGWTVAFVCNLPTPCPAN